MAHRAATNGSTLGARRGMASVGRSYGSTLGARRLPTSEHAALLDRTDTFLFDCDGVIWRGEATLGGLANPCCHYVSHRSRVYLCIGNPYE